MGYLGGGVFKCLVSFVLVPVCPQQAHNVVATSFAGSILTSELGQWEVVFATLMTSDFNDVTKLKSDVVAASCSGCILTSELGQWEVVFATPMTSDFNVVTTLKHDVIFQLYHNVHKMEFLFLPFSLHAKETNIAVHDTLQLPA